MKIDMIVATWPPQLNGIGDYAYCQAEALCGKAKIRVLTGEAAGLMPLSGVEVVPTFSISRPNTVRAIAGKVEADRPDWILLQYNPFAYGHWGRNLHLPLVLRRIKRKHSRVRLAVMIHEPFVPLDRWQFAIMSLWQRWQFRALGDAADVVFVSIDPWALRFRSWFPDTPVVHLPVGSNITRIPIERDEARRRLGIRENTSVLGIFGTFGQARMMELIRGAAQKIHQISPDSVLLYVGPHGAAVRAGTVGIPSITDGPHPSEEVSRRLAAMDVYLAPFTDGVSTRRGSVMAALQHGIATVGTEGALTDSVLRTENGRSLLLADVADAGAFDDRAVRLHCDGLLRQQIGEAGKRLYEQQFAVDKMAARLMETFARFESPDGG